MFWNNEEKRFSWAFIILAVYSTIALVIFDLAWRHLQMGFVQLAAITMVCWTVGATIIYLKGRKN